MATVQYFEDLRMWKEARALSKWYYQIVQQTELKKDFKLKNQADASSGSIMDNIAEGFERNGRKEFLQFLSIAKASCGEFRSQLHRIYDRHYISKQDLETKQEELKELSKGISSLMNYLKNSDKEGWKFLEKQSPYDH